MPVDVRIPTLGESVTEGVILRWLKTEGESVRRDDLLLELETDKASVEIPAESAGVLHIVKAEGEKVQVGEVVARIDQDGKSEAAAKQPAAAPAPAASPVPPAAEATPSAAPVPMATSAQAAESLSPAVRRLVEEHGLQPAAIAGSGRGGRITKADVLAHVEKSGELAAPSPAPTLNTQTPAPSPQPAAPSPQDSALSTQHSAPSTPHSDDERRVPMTYLRQRIAERLVQAQHTAAILTTFNEIDMTAILDLRARHKERFAEKHGVGLGFMSFFARACILALRDVPAANAHIDGKDIVYKDRVHLGVAVGTERGLVVPVVHNADLLTFAEIEKEIGRLAGLARQSKLSINDLSGGTFTISNGGVYGSLMSTPILNPPQSAILGMHKIEKRPVVVGDQIVIRPMMYLAVSYDHRLIDGENAVTFLVRIKERIEDPARLLLEI